MAIKIIFLKYFHVFTILYKYANSNIHYSHKASIFPERVEIYFLPIFLNFIEE